MEKHNNSVALVFLVLLQIGATTAVAQEVKSLHPLFTEKAAFVDSSLFGTWYDDLGDTLTFRRAGDNFYHLIDASAGESSSFEAMLVKIDRLIILDIFPRLPAAKTDFYGHLIPSHSFYCISIQSDTMRVLVLSYQWFYDAVANGKFPYGYQWAENGILLTASQEELRNTFLKYHDERDFFGDSFLFYRQKQQPPSLSEKAPASHPASSHAGFKLASLPDIAASHPECQPRFPYVDGWLGGDGDLSIPLSKTQNLWIFSDTFVGKKDQASREGAHMVANTIAISSCDDKYGWRIEYFWRNQYTDNPCPFFESHTNRYKFWPNEVFAHGGHIYVALHKVGPRYGAAPDEIFNFSLLGTTLAKITVSGTPDQWGIELIPWSSVYDPNSWNGGMVKSGDYLYTFMGRERKKAYLTRLPLDHHENPREYIEYFAKDGKWKPGLDPDDACVLIEDVIGGSVRYHDDLKRWVMIYGPNFLSNKILMRTAPEITGPWSEAVVLYEAPEQIRNAPEYDEGNFCYCAREHFQFYNRKNQNLLITYDCNATNFTKLVSNMKLYSPRVLSIRFPK